MTESDYTGEERRRDAAPLESRVYVLERENADFRRFMRENDDQKAVIREFGVQLTALSKESGANTRAVDKLEENMSNSLFELRRDISAGEDRIIKAFHALQEQQKATAEAQLATAKTVNVVTSPFRLLGSGIGGAIKTGGGWLIVVLVIVAIFRLLGFDLEVPWRLHPTASSIPGVQTSVTVTPAPDESMRRVEEKVDRNYNALKEKP